MQWFLNMRTGSKIFLSFGIIILLQASILVIAYKNMTHIQQSEEMFYKHEFALVNELMSLRNAQNAVRAALLTMVISKSTTDQDALSLQIKNDTVDISTSFEKISDLIQNSPSAVSKFFTLKKIYEEYLQTRDTQVIPSIKEKKIDNAIAITTSIQQERYEKIKTIVDDLVAEAKNSANNSINESTLMLNNAINVLLTIASISLFFAIFVAIVLSHMIANPLREMSLIAEKIATGDLTLNVNSKIRMDEVGLLATNFQAMVINLRKLTSEISEAVSFLGSSASEISSTTTQMASSAAETATSVSETTSTIEEVRQTSQVANQKAKAVSEASQKSAEISQSGKKAADEINQMINQIHTQMELIGESMVRLSEQSQAIGDIITTVDDLAQQSNLLSVNASIEAAKAGEQGKGFAVVAQEVKSLANQSKQATNQVRVILSDIQKATSAAVMATEQGSKAVEAGVLKSTQTGESILKLVSSVTDASHAATQIAATSHQQLIGMDQAALAMESIKQASAQNVDSVKQLEVAARNLNGMGIKLQQLVGQYKVSESPDKE